MFNRSPGELAPARLGGNTLPFIDVVLNGGDITETTTVTLITLGAATQGDGLGTRFWYRGSGERNLREPAELRIDDVRVDAKRRASCQSGDGACGAATSDSCRRCAGVPIAGIRQNAWTRVPCRGIASMLQRPPL